MRTTLDIDDDVLEAAKELARAEKKTVGRVVSDSIRRALTSAPGFGEGSQPVLDRGWHVLPRREGAIVTTELVERLLEEADFEDAGLIKPE